MLPLAEQPHLLHAIAYLIARHAEQTGSRRLVAVAAFERATHEVVHEVLDVDAIRRELEGVLGGLRLLTECSGR